MKINNKEKIHKLPFKSQGLYNLTAQIQENTILNRGLLDLGGCAIPHMIMANNKDEAKERGTMSALYFVTAFVAPFVLLPFFNKKALSHNGMVKNFENNEKRIIEVSKKYLIKDAELMLEGFKKTAEKLVIEAEKKGKKINVKEDFNNIINRFSDKEELKNKLLKTHEQVLFSDFLATAWMWCATPWIATEVTKARTKRSGFSATYGIASEEQTRKNAEKHEKEKKKKLLISALIGTIPALFFPKLVTKALKNDLAPLIKSKNIFARGWGHTLNLIKKTADNWNYTKGMYPSKTIFGAIWLLCDYPSALVSSRDKYERRDRAARNAATFAVFFGGDFALNNIFGRLSDKVLKTQIMDRSKIGNNKSKFFKKMLMVPKNFTELADLKDIAPKTLKKTKSVGAGLYWLTLFANMGLLGFGMPAVMNKILKNNINKDMSYQQNTNKTAFVFKNQNKLFKKFGFAK